ncbi:alkyl hydroperoxide reductase [Micromonospora sp. 15K316]|uniref:carboxymuconolactone decarboxylase family protein n=1 Tax=Micromonospora sp. 15K316 TaxID=2530376 RepID=UPI001044077E|nr:carboxymuconolactone decarboxylase family protein [Micromonospora sp. 15K316]TDC36520.1 alkyl hydroperoxide reductase [Micromonospora sp. 15K316]
MGVDALKAGLPGYAEDVSRNLRSTIEESPLTPAQLWGTALACAVAARNPVVLREIAAEAAGHLAPEQTEAAKGAATIMAMTNVYYRAKHMLDEEYQSIHGRLRMQLVARPGVPKVDFELWCLAVSAINGCEVCLESHEKKLRAAGIGPDQVNEALRIAAVVHAAAVAYDAQSALA